MPECLGREMERSEGRRQLPRRFGTLEWDTSGIRQQAEHATSQVNSESVYMFMEINIPLRQFASRPMICLIYTLEHVKSVVLLYALRCQTREHAVVEPQMCPVKETYAVWKDTAY